MKPWTSVTKPLDAGDRVPTGIEQAKKHLENALSNLEFYQDTHAADDIQQALEILRTYVS